MMNNTDWMDGEVKPDYNVMQQMNEFAQRLRQLDFEMMEAEEAYNKAKAKRDEFATKVLPEYFTANGMSSIKCQDGVRIDIVTQTRASIKKGKDDGETAKANIAKWLRSHNGEGLIKSICQVPSSEIAKLQQAGIIFQEKTDINTNSLKAFIIDALGQNGSPATITQQDIPDGLSFFQWNEAKAIYDYS